MKMILSIRENCWTVRGMERVKISGKMGQSMKGIEEVISLMVKVRS